MGADGLSAPPPEGGDLSLRSQGLNSTARNHEAIRRSVSLDTDEGGTCGASGAGGPDDEVVGNLNAKLAGTWKTLPLNVRRRRKRRHGAPVPVPFFAATAYGAR